MTLLLVCSCEVHQSAIASKLSVSKVVCGCSDEYCEQQWTRFACFVVCSVWLNGPLLSQTTHQNRYTFVTTKATMHPCKVWPSQTKSQTSRGPARAVTRALSTSPGKAVCLAKMAYLWSAPGSWYLESQLTASMVLPSCLQMLLQTVTKWSVCSGERGPQFAILQLLSQRTICSAIVALNAGGNADVTLNLILLLLAARVRPCWEQIDWTNALSATPAPHATRAWTALGCRRTGYAKRARIVATQWDRS